MTGAGRTDAEVAALAARCAATLAARRGELARRFGWAGEDLQARAEPRRRALVVAGATLTARTREAALAALTAALPAGWTLDARAVTLATPQRWYALRGGLTRLQRAPAGAHAGELCTELLPADGPVGLLALRGASALVQASDGTLGWLAGARLGGLAGVPERSNRTCLKRHAYEDLSRALRTFIGAPYALGGTTREGVDCSGLVQRCVRSALGVVLPRHSRDQLALAAPAARPLGEPGDLLFLWGSGEQGCHVGVVLRGPGRHRRTVLHASSRRGQVVEEPLARVLARASAVRHVELGQVLALDNAAG